jgi:hypothetical protein
VSATIRVRDPFQVCHEGVVYRPGEIAQVSVHVATLWQEAGWVVNHADEESASGRNAK